MGTRGRARLAEGPPGSVQTGLVCVGEAGGFLSCQGSDPGASHHAGRAVENEGQESVLLCSLSFRICRKTSIRKQ